MSRQSKRVLDQGDGSIGIQRTFQRKDMQIVLFKLSGVFYGVDVAQVQSVVDVVSITTIPNAPHYVEGVTNLRGEIIPVIDLRKKFKMSERGPSEDFKMVVVRLDRDAVGVLVDTVTVVMDLAKDDIEDIPDLVSDIDDDAIIGVAKENDDLIVLLDLVKVVQKIDVPEFDTTPPDIGPEKAEVPVVEPGLVFHLEPVSSY